MSAHTSQESYDIHPIRLYWSHCGTYRVWGEKMQIPLVKTYDDVVKLGIEVAASGYSALKANVLLLGDGNPRVRNAGFGKGDGYAINEDRGERRSARSQHRAA